MGPLFIDLEGTELEPGERELLAHPLVAGVILFSRNYLDREQLENLVRQIRQSRSEPLLIVTDHEGGRVQRFRKAFTELPSPGTIQFIAQEHQLTATELARELGWLMAAELRACDIDLSLAPVLDCDGISDVIGDRAFSAVPSDVADIAGAWIDGMHSSGMRSVGKHFPGHGSVKADSHVSVAIDERSYNEIFATDLLPFQQLINQHKLDAIMPAHVRYPQVCEHPAGFSATWLKDILRQQFGFTGVIFSDDLSMKAASVEGDIQERALQALNAGCDLLLACNDRPGTELLLDRLSIEWKSDKALLLEPKATAMAWSELTRQSRYQKAQQILAGFGK
ncbi:beta-N-acetylhexosaminidase [Celerinatantimonas sp. YJH-8]|uniref:beta-N-acetylhexosaminidase n=1 Tax=Celerinatantimonas sp. YJH-8 TaxID=3228714 RepID=UPI0038CB341F